MTLRDMGADTELTESRSLVAERQGGTLAASTTFHITFLNRKPTGFNACPEIKRFTCSITEEELYGFWLDRHLLNTLTPAYVLRTNPPTGD